MGIEGTVALVTGGAGGIGGAISERFAADGGRVAVVDRDAAGAERMAALVGGIAVVADLMEPGACDRVVAEVTERVHELRFARTCCERRFDLEELLDRFVLATRLVGATRGLEQARELLGREIAGVDTAVFVRESEVLVQLGPRLRVLQLAARHRLLRCLLDQECHGGRLESGEAARQDVLSPVTGSGTHKKNRRPLRAAVLVSAPVAVLSASGRR